MKPSFSPNDIAQLERSVRQGVNATLGRMRQEAKTADEVRFMSARQVFDERIAAARVAAPVGRDLPPMGKQTGLKRLALVPFAKAILRIGQLVTRQQRDFNHQTIEILLHLQVQVDDLRIHQANTLEALRKDVAAIAARVDAVERRK